MAGINKYLRVPLKILFTGALTVAGGVIFLSAMYYLTEFRPYLKEIKSIVDSTHPLHKEPPEPVVDVVKFVEGEEALRYWAARFLLFEFEFHKGKSNGKFNIDNMIWTYLLDFHLTDSEIFALWCHFAPYENGRGLNESARFHYNRNLDQLNFDELITIAAIPFSPSRFKANPYALQKRVIMLKNRYDEKY